MYQYGLSSIAGECEHLTRLIYELLDVSRLEHGRLDVKRTYQDMLAPLTQIITTYAQTSTRHRVHLILEEVKPAERLMG